MYEARGRSDWDRTSMLIAVVINMMRDPKKSRGVVPTTFNPFRNKKKKTIPIVPLTVLKDVFVR